MLWPLKRSAESPDRGVNPLTRISHTGAVGIAFWGGVRASRGLQPRACPRARLRRDPWACRLGKSRDADPAPAKTRPFGRGKSSDGVRYPSGSMPRIDLRRLPALSGDFPPCRRRQCEKAGLRQVSRVSGKENAHLAERKASGDTHAQSGENCHRINVGNGRVHP